MSLAIEMKNVTKRFERDVVLDNVDFSVSRGRVHAVIGPNGAGKSTLLKLMVNLLNPSSGEICVMGEPVRDNPRVRQWVHYVGADTHIFPMFKVGEVLQYARLLYDAWDEVRCQQLVAAWGMPVTKRVRQLSLGMKMKLKWMMAFAAMPQVLLLDEALTGIDPVSKQQIVDMLLQEVALRDVTVICATHELSEVEQMADTLSVLGRGRILATKNVDQLKEHVCEIAALVPSGHDVNLQDHAILSVKQAGRRCTLVLEGDTAEAQAELERSGGSVIDIRAVSLEHWFQALLVKEGMVGGRIQLSKSIVL
ncbi:ABC transporter ATP-binding protein [Alicyclobacillus fodiniaquatilis]|uniref:ABC transporter ATP-binding protein n=1 Tax=Alicyclobacillus fodiniaquatilis TaxID=1661150 RepID=A0ABW4JLM4_9BACL